MIGWLEYGWMYFLRGGVVMWPLLLCSLVSLTLILERGAFFRREDSGRDYPRTFCRMVRQKQWQDLLAMSRRTRGAGGTGNPAADAPPEAREKESYILGESQQLVSPF